MTAQPGPGIIDLMIGHQNLISVLVDHPGGSRHVSQFVLPVKGILIHR